MSTCPCTNAASGHTYAVLDTDQVKCWGGNCDAELGLGDYTDRGTTPSSMGNGLPYTQLW